MSTPRASIMAIWAISSWPAINFIAQNWSEVHRGGLRSLSWVFVITMGFGLIGHGLQWIATRWKRGDLVVPWVVAICLFFGYLAMRQVFIPLVIHIHTAVPPYTAWFLCVAIAMSLAWWKRNSVRWQMAARTFSFVATGAAPKPFCW